MSNISLPAALIRPFVPSTDFSASRSFYIDIGCTLTGEAEKLAFFSFAGAPFILQEFNEPEFANNYMLTLGVPDLDVWWTQFESIDLSAHRVRPAIAPQMKAWGIRQATFFDPSGVLWYVAQNR